MRSLYLVCFSFSLLLFGCGKKDGVVPTFVHIPSLTFDANINQGTDSHDLTEVWVVSGGKNLGAYQLPADVPIIGSGSTGVTLLAGINNNGQTDAKIVYPYIEPFVVTLDMSPGSRDTITPHFEYRDNLGFLNDPFEAGTLLQATDQSNSEIELVSGEEAFEGQSGKITLTDSNVFFRGEMLDAIDLPEGEAVFLEINYKANNSFAIGVQSTVSGNEQDSFAIVAFGESAPEWKKLYVELSFAMQQIAGADTYKLYLESQLDSGDDTGEIYLDNFKIVYFD